MRFSEGVKKSFYVALSLILVLALVFSIPVSAAAKKTGSGTAAKKQTAAAAENRWTVTQYSTNNGHGMFYTVEDAKKRLVIIDGGWTSDAGKVKKVIRKHKNHVYAWILTHPDEDHIGAFNSIMSNRGKIRVDHIYTTYVDPKKYNKKRGKVVESDYRAFQKFRKLAPKLKKLKYLKTGDTLDVIGLKMTVYNAWSKEVWQRSKNYVSNTASLVFKLEGKRQSFLFTGDVTKTMQKDIVKRLGKNISSDYVQCSHHGNWTLSNSFYGNVKPKAAFVDASASITKAKRYYSAPKLIAYLKKRGAKVYTFSGAPHSVTLK